MYKHIQAACVSHLGNVRNNNEDNYYFDGSYLPSENNGSQGIVSSRFLQSVGSNKGLFYAVFDGMGGGDYGEIASFKCAEETRLFFSDDKNINNYDITPTLQTLCSVLNGSVYREKTNLGVYQMGSTIVSVYLFAGRAWVCNVGDSRCFIYREKTKELKLLSVDHVEESMQSSKPMLTQYIGIDPEEMRIEPSVFCFEPERSDKVLLCSDGLTDMVSEDDIRKVLQLNSPQDSVTDLLGKALSAGGKDNITMIVIKFC